MVSSEKYNLIFLRIPKNASTSLATWFVQNTCDQSDIWTNIGDSKIEPNNFPQTVLNKYRVQYRKIHLTLNELVNESVIAQNDVMTRRVIGVVRNPYHRQLSLFFFKSKNGDKSVKAFRSEFAKGCHSTDLNNQILQSDYFKLGDQFTPFADPWLYEDINKRLESLTEELRLTVNSPLATYKSNRKPKDMFTLEKEYYDDATREAVYNYYKKDFDLIDNIK
jgi:hypothetical protein